jgi:hypothetical protein
MNLPNLCHALAAAAVLAGALSAVAAPITYEISGIGSGHIGGTQFSNAAFTLTGGADTDAMASIGGGVSVNPLLSMKVDVGGHSTVLALEAFDFFVNNALSGAGFIDELLGDVLDVLGPDLTGFDGISALGPSPVDVDYLAAFPTTAGEFQLDNARMLSFQARLDPSPVPEPATSWLVVCALMAIGVARRPPLGMTVQVTARGSVKPSAVGAP